MSHMPTEVSHRSDRRCAGRRFPSHRLPQRQQRDRRKLVKGHTPGCACNWCHITRQRQRHDKFTQLTTELDKVREENARLARTIQTLVKDMPQEEYITLVADSVA